MNNTRILINNLKIFQGINQNVTNIFLILFGTLLLTISAKVQVPFWPVPMTMQTFMVFLIGATYGVRLSFFTLVAYLFEGAIGLPVFATGGGIVYLTGPTAGYLYGMTIAAVVISYFADKGFSASYYQNFYKYHFRLNINFCPWSTLFRLNHWIQQSNSSWFTPLYSK